MSLKDRKFRHELKFLIDAGDMELLKQRLGAVLKRDKHAKNGQYKIRSLYFDDYFNTAYKEKLMGIQFRRKYRIRIYDDSDKVIKLECKMKADQYISKTAASLTREEYDMIIDGKYDFLLKRKENLCKEFYYQCTSRVMRPRTIVDYEREPFIMEAGDVRITFDHNVRAAMGKDIFNSDLPCIYVIEPGKTVLEVKFTEFLPKIVQQVLPMRNSEKIAISKFVLCCEAVNFEKAITNTF